MDMDKLALDSSEVFQEYLAIQNKNDLKNQVNKDEVLISFAEFEESVKKDPKKLKVFRALQDKFANDLEYREKVNPSFVDGVMMLNLYGRD